MSRERLDEIAEAARLTFGGNTIYDEAVTIARAALSAALRSENDRMREGLERIAAHDEDPAGARHASIPRLTRTEATVAARRALASPAPVVPKIAQEGPSREWLHHAAEVEAGFPVSAGIGSSGLDGEACKRLPATPQGVSEAVKLLVRCDGVNNKSGKHEWRTSEIDGTNDGWCCRCCMTASAIVDALHRILILAASPAPAVSEAEREVVARTGVTHPIKCWRAPFAAVRSGVKAFEFRKDDRGYRVGDVLALHEYCNVTGDFSGAVEHRVVTYIAKGGEFGIPHGYCVMSIAAVARLRDARKEAQP